MHPNILFLFSDQHRGDWLPGENPAIPLAMPYLRSLMDQGTTFTNAITNSPLCAPARACLALGTDYTNCQTFNNEFSCPVDRPTFYSRLRDAGYDVRGVGKFDLHKPIMHWGEDGQIPQHQALGFTHAIENEGKGDACWAYQHGTPGPYGKFLKSQQQIEIFATDHKKRSNQPLDSSIVDLPDELYADNWVTKNALTELDQQLSSDTPWFLMVNFSGPHDPWDITKSMQKYHKDDQYPIPSTYTGDPVALNKVRQNYADMLENIDYNIGLILEKIRSAGKMDETVIIYASDHGEMLGNRNRFYKSVPYQPSLHIPMIISAPCAREASQKLSSPVQLSDLAATILDFAQISTSDFQSSYSLKALVEKRSNVPVRCHQYSALNTGLAPTEHTIPGYEDLEPFHKHKISASESHGGANWQCAIYKNYKLIRDFNNSSTILYDMDQDPNETRNIYHEASQKIISPLLAILDAHISQQLIEEVLC